MTAQEDLRQAVRAHLVPALRGLGFRGSAPTWTVTSSRDDVAVVNVQSSSSSTRDELRCIVNLAVAPRPWLDWRQHLWGRPLTSVKEHDGLWRDRLTARESSIARGSESWWVVSDSASARAAALDMSTQVVDVHDRIDVLLDRPSFLAAVSTGDLDAGTLTQPPEWVRLMLLADEPPSREFTELLASVADDPGHRADTARKLVDWARTYQSGRAARVR